MDITSSLCVSMQMFFSMGMHRFFCLDFSDLESSCEAVTEAIEWEDFLLSLGGNTGKIMDVWTGSNRAPFIFFKCRFIQVIVKLNSTWILH